MLEVLISTRNSENASASSSEGREPASLCTSKRKGACSRQRVSELCLRGNAGICPYKVPSGRWGSGSHDVIPPSVLMPISTL